MFPLVNLRELDLLFDLRLSSVSSICVSRLFSYLVKISRRCLHCHNENVTRTQTYLFFALHPRSPSLCLTAQKMKFTFVTPLQPFISLSLPPSLSLSLPLSVKAQE